MAVGEDGVRGGSHCVGLVGGGKPEATKGGIGIVVEIEM